ncbi:MAG: histone deacetylase [Planctomycetota bacterium]|nr:histone deacetylase [Planctomycetota bacterium]
MSSTGLVTHAFATRHDTGSGHPERAARVESVLERLRDSGLTAEMQALEGPLCTLADLVLVHDEKYIDTARRAIESGARVLDEGDTRVSADSWRAACATVGGAIAAVSRVQRGEWRNAFVAARPPGHHAERAEAMGFCVFNNAAVAAAHLVERMGVERVAILDWDVHHGNGTQHIFERDPRVFYASLHQWPLYPGTGAHTERGIGDGLGTTLNLPQRVGAGDREWLGAFDDVLLPAFDDFRPQFVIISAGFDAHADDPLAQTELSTAAFATMTRRLVEWTKTHCDGRLVSLLEGGYDLDALADSVEAHVGELVRST